MYLVPFKGKNKLTINDNPISITKTCLYTIDLLKPHLYIVKVEFTEVYNILFSAQNHRLWYLLEPPRRGGSNEYHNLCFEQKYEKISEFFI